MLPLEGKVAWITGAGSGIGEATALALAQAGASLVLTGRRREPLQSVAERVRGLGRTAHIKPGDLTAPATAQDICAFIKAELQRLDILVNNAGVTILERSWKQLRPEGVDQMLRGNLASAFYCVQAALPMMRAQCDGVIINTASWAGRWVRPNPAYTAAKHGVVAMSHSINMEECVNGIRSCALCPAEVATPILDMRPYPASKEDRAQMVQPEDCADLIRYIATLPKHLCINEVVISPTWNRMYIGESPQKK